jgi:hypothetical protein
VELRRRAFEQALIQAIDDRNRLSHIYDERTFREILVRVRGHAALFRRVAQALGRDAAP